MIRKRLAFALVLFLILGLLPGLPMQTAAAADFTVTNESGLRAAVDSAATDDVIVVGTDITLTSDLTVNKNVTLISSGAKIIAGGYKIIIPAGSSVSFGQSLSVTGSTATGHNDGLIVVAGRLTLEPGSVSVTNSYAGGLPANSAAVYVVTGGWLTVNGGTISDTATGGNFLSAGIYLNGGEADISGGLVTGSGNGIESRGGAWLRISGGTVSGNCGIFFYGSDGGTMYMTGGTVNGTYAAVRVVGSPAAQSSRIIGGTITASAGYGVAIEQFSDMLISGCSITGTAGEGGIFVESGSTLNLYRDSVLSVSGGVRAFDGTINYIAYLSALPAQISVTQDDSVSFSLTGAETTFAIDDATTASLNASLSADTHTVTLQPTALGSKTLVLTSSVDLHDDDYGGDYSNSLQLTIPIEVTEPTVLRGTWLDDEAYYDTDWYNADESSFVITNAAELAGFAKLTADGNDFMGKTVLVDAPGGIDLSAHDWVPAGAFLGTFDGGDDSITGLTIGTVSTPETMYSAAGLFGHLASATVRNVRLTGILIYSGARHTGGLAGEIYNSTISGCSAVGLINCYGEDARNAGALLGIVTATRIETCSSAGSVLFEYADSSTSTAYAGGLCGQVAANSVLSGCHNTANVHIGKKEAYAGGIAGIILESSIEKCSNSGAISNTGDTAADAENNDHYLGGIAGVFRGSMQLCYNTGTVQGSGLLVFCGGISGIMNLLDTNSILNSYNTSSVCATGAETYSGGIVSILHSDSGIIQNCFNIGMVTGTLSGTAYAGGIISNELPGALTSCYYLQGTVSGDGGNNPMAKSVSDFHESGTFSGWDFGSVWQFAAGMGRYPTLRSNAQTRGYAYPLSFHITDNQNAALTGATVTLSLSGDILSYPHSNASGYSSASISAGNYSYTVKKSGYTDFTGTVLMSENTSAVIPITMQSETGSTAPTVTTGAVSGITSSGASFSGYVTSDGGAEVTERGFVYGSTADPTIGGAGVTKVTAGIGTGSFAASITGLAAGTTFHVRAYAINSEGTSYGEDQTFVTLGDGGGVPTSAGVLGDSSRDADIIVNGTLYKAGEESSETVGGKTTIIVTVDTDRLEAILDDAGKGALVVIPIEGDCSAAKGVLDGLMIKALVENGATLELRTASAAYSIPASLLEIDAIKEQLGASASLGNITLELIISEPSDQMASVVENAASLGGFSLVVPAVDFTAIYTYAGQTTAITDFNAYVTRRIAIPEGTDPKSVTTVVTVDTAGKVRPLPTKLVTISGVTYAQFVSLANSTYAVISHSAAFNDISGHWAQAVINDMGSRLIVSGIGGGRYEPDRNMTRAEFAAIMVYALGIAPKTDASSFPDVKTTDWYCGYIEAAYKYGLIKGCSDGTFGPDVLITREQAMIIMVRAMRLTEVNTDLKAAANDILSAFADQAGLSSYARQSAAVCVKAGLVYGKNSRILAPQDYIARAEVAAIVQRLLKISDLI